MDYKAKYEQWCQDPIFDKETNFLPLQEMKKRSRIVFTKIFPLEQVDFAA